MTISKSKKLNKSQIKGLFEFPPNELSLTTILEKELGEKKSKHSTKRRGRKKSKHTRKKIS